ncbi:hypothetical protein ACHAXT_010839 [Thalassiosira profunda]
MIAPDDPNGQLPHVELRQKPHVSKETFDVYELQSVLRDYCILVPASVLVSVFKRGRRDESAAGEERGPFCRLSLRDIVQLLHGSTDEGVALAAMKATAFDAASVLYFLAGLFLVVGVFPLKGYDRYGIIASTLAYLLPVGYSAISTPIKTWRDLIASERNVGQFKEAVRRKATDYESLKVDGGTSVIPKRESRSRVLSREFLILMQYVEEVICCGCSGAVLTKTDIELHLLSELGTSFTSDTLEYTLTLMGHGSSTINAFTFHAFVASDDGGRDPGRMRRYSHRLVQVLKSMLGLRYILGLCFFVALCINTLLWSLKERGSEEPAHLATISLWLFLVAVRDREEAKQRARMLLASSIRWAQHYHRDAEIWKSYRQNRSLNTTALTRILESSDVLLSESEIREIIREIKGEAQISEDGNISKEEFEAYLGRTSRSTRILSRSMRDFNFIFNLSWFVGSVAFLVPTSSGNTVGALGYFLGGCGYCAMTNSAKRAHLSTLAKLKRATEQIDRTRYAGEMISPSSRKSVAQIKIRKALIERQYKSGNIDDPLHRLANRRILVKLLSRSACVDEESGLLSKSTKVSLKELKQKRVQRMIQSLTENDQSHRATAVETFLSHILSFSSGSDSEVSGRVVSFVELDCSIASPMSGSLHMYRLNLDGDPDEHAGFLYAHPSCCNRSEVAREMSAQFSADRTKICIRFPPDSGGSDESTTTQASSAENIGGAVPERMTCLL